MRLAEVNWTAETLTAIFSPSGHRTASAQAWANTHSPRGTMRPSSSARGMNSAGETKPRVGCFQRKSASKPQIRSVPKL